MLTVPSFWMTYFAVDDVARTTSLAQKLGGRVELEEDGALGRIALIRDPLGAGFTCYEGDQPSALEARRDSGHWMGSDLFVSDFAAIEDFYRKLMRWQLAPASSNHEWAAYSESGERVCTIHQGTVEEKGEKEYWSVSFRASDLATVSRSIANLGGLVLHQDDLTVLAYDDQGAYFRLVA